MMLLILTNDANKVNLHQTLNNVYLITVCGFIEEFDGTHEIFVCNSGISAENRKSNYSLLECIWKPR